MVRAAECLSGIREAQTIQNTIPASTKQTGSFVGKMQNLLNYVVRFVTSISTTVITVDSSFTSTAVAGDEDYAGLSVSFAF